MNWFTALILYFLTWWTVLFCVLPWGIKTPEIPEKGHMGGAPLRPGMKIKLLATTGVSVIVWLIIYTLIEIDIIDFREIAMGMIEEDKVR